MEDYDKIFMEEAIALARKAVEENLGGPFGAVVVKDGQIIGRGYNQVPATCDPTAHAEIVAIRAACKALDSFQLTGCTIYTSCEPCPMCLGAIYWARPDNIVMACTRKDAASIGFDDDYIYKELGKDLTARKIPVAHALRREALMVFALWEKKADKTKY